MVESVVWPDPCHQTRLWELQLGELEDRNRLRVWKPRAGRQRITDHSKKKASRTPGSLLPVEIRKRGARVHIAGIQCFELPEERVGNSGIRRNCSLRNWKIERGFASGSPEQVDRESPTTAKKRLPEPRGAFFRSESQQKVHACT
jgi:hypothetical protein